MLPFPDVATTIPNPSAARGSLLELREEPRNSGTRELRLDPWQAPRAIGAQPRGGGLSKRSSAASLRLVVRAENPSRQKLGDSQCRPGGDRRADRRSLEPRRFGPKRESPGNGAQRLEKIESGPGNGMASEASNPQHLVRGSRGRPCAAPADEPRERSDFGFGKLQSKGKRGKSPGGREIVAALAERGRRRAPHFLKVDQAEPTRSATASTAAPGLLPSYEKGDAELKSAPALGIFFAPDAGRRPNGRVGVGMDMTKRVARVGEAMIVAHSMMMQGDLQAMDRLLALNGELDRYHLPPRPGRRRPASSRRRARCWRRVRLPAEGEGNFPPRKALKSHETRKFSPRPSPASEEGGASRSGSRHPGRAGAARLRGDLFARDLDVDLQRRDRAGALQLHRQLFGIEFDMARDGGEQLVAQDREQIARAHRNPLVREQDLEALARHRRRAARL